MKYHGYQTHVVIPDDVLKIDKKAFIRRKDRAGAGLLAAFLVFSLITGTFSVLNVFDDKSYVVASAVSELYVLTMMSVIGYLSYYLAYRNTKVD